MAKDMTEEQRARRKERKLARKLRKSQGNENGTVAVSVVSESPKVKEFKAARAPRIIRVGQVTEEFVQAVITELGIKGYPLTEDHVNRCFMVWRDQTIFDESDENPVEAAKMMLERHLELGLPEPKFTVRFRNNTFGLGPISGPRDNRAEVVEIDA